ncbi:MAG: hypothetical protein AUH84_03700 [Thaumarchaeota archaeon 13_1_40CM_4_38_7]|nr:MAG: hypothetical protein AUH84_03700 [Thaumarchaeota archaeon 13_1_40CM_4_38_7]
MIIAIVNEIKYPELIDKLLKLNHELFVPSSVYDELLDENSKRECKGLIENDKLKVCRLNTKTEVEDFQKSYPYLGKGECDSMLQFTKLTKNAQKVYCILDDKPARKVADSLNIQYTGLLGLVKLLKNRNAITSNEYDNIMKALEGSTFRMPRDVK